MPQFPPWLDPSPAPFYSLRSTAQLPGLEPFPISAKPSVSELSEFLPKPGRSGLKGLSQSWRRGWGAPQGAGKGDNGANSFHIPQGNLSSL